MYYLADPDVRVMTDQGVDYLAQLEGLSLTPYPDGPNGTYSIGRGHQIKPGEEWMMGGITEQQADDIFLDDIAMVEEAVNETITSNTSDRAWDALCMFAFNIGWDNFRSSQLAELVNAPVEDFSGGSQAEKDQFIYDFWLTTWVGNPAKDVLLDRRQKEADYAMIGAKHGGAQAAGGGWGWWLALLIGGYAVSKS